MEERKNRRTREFVCIAHFTHAMQLDVSSNPVSHLSLIRLYSYIATHLSTSARYIAMKARRRLRREKMRQAMDSCCFFIISLPRQRFTPVLSPITPSDRGLYIDDGTCHTSLRFRTHSFTALPSRITFSASFLPSVQVTPSHPLVASSHLHFARAGPAKPPSIHTSLARHLLPLL